MLEDQLNSSSITLDESLLQYGASVDPSLITSTNVATPTPVRNGGLSTTTTTGATGIQDIDGVLAGIQWTNKNLTYSFPTLSTQYGTYSSGELTTFAAVNATMQTAIKYALAQYASFSGLTFTQNTASPGSATLRFGISASASPTAYAYYPSGAVQGGDVWFGTQTGGSAMTNPVLGGYAFISAMHELGNALGLKHGQETGGPANTAMTAAHDSMEYSIMTYLSYTGGPATGYTNEQWGFAQTPMMYDIAAIQDMYGANFSGPSNQIYSFDPATGQELINGVGQGTPGGNRIFRTIWDGGGNAEYDFSNYTTNETVRLTPGGYSTLSPVQLAYLVD